MTTLTIPKSANNTLFPSQVKSFGQRRVKQKTQKDYLSSFKELSKEQYEDLITILDEDFRKGFREAHQRKGIPLEEVEWKE